LASGSAGRIKLLKKTGFRFKIKKTNANEIVLKSPRKTVIENSVLKAKTGYEKNKIIIGCDTIVYFKGKLIGKPKNKNDAKKTLRILSGKWHSVYSGIAGIKNNKLICGVSISKVKLKRLDKKYVEKECKNRVVLKRAGAYAIQEKNSPIEKYVGRFDTIVGIDISLLKIILEALKK
jgi:septum formation protein